MRLLTTLLLLSIFLTGCSTIEHTSIIEQPINKIQFVGVGDIVLKVNKQRTLENAFGKADIFGRKTNEGSSELRYAGVEKNGEVVFYRKDVKIITNETTMSRSSVSSTTGTTSTNTTGNYNGGSNYGNVSLNSQTTHSSTTLNPTSDFHVVVPENTIPIKISRGITKVPMEGYNIEIIKATSSSLEYRIY